MTSPASILSAIPSSRTKWPANLLLCVALLATPCLADDWPQWLGPNRNGVSLETGWRADWPKAGPPELWRRNVGKGYSTVTVRGDRVYTMGNAAGHDVVWRLDADTGRAVWKFRYPCRGGGNGWPGTRIVPMLDGDRVYTLSLKGQIHCLNAETGEKIWSVDSVRELGAKGGRHGFSCQPVIDENRVFFELGARGGSVVAFDKKTGKILWRAGRHKVGHSSPIVYASGKDRYLVVFTGSGLVGMRLSDGKELWQFPCRITYHCNIATPVVSGDRVFISSVYYDKGAVLLRIGKGKPEVLWQTKKLQNHCSNSVLWKGYLYGFDGWVQTRGGKGVLRCVDFDTGKVMWSQSGFGTGALTIADGKLIVQGDRGELAIGEATPKGYRPLGTAKPLDGRCWNMPVLANGRIYCRSFEGELVCLDVRQENSEDPSRR